MKLTKILLCLMCLSLVACAEMGLKAHKPNLDSTLQIAKDNGVYRIVTIKGGIPEMDSVLNKDVMNCNTTTFSIPRGHSVSTFMREIFEQELDVAKKLSTNGSGIDVVINSLTSETSKLERGTWTLDIDYTENGKTTNVHSVTEFESKLSALSACINTANMFEAAIADNFVAFFKKKNR